MVNAGSVWGLNALLLWKDRHSRYGTVSERCGGAGYRRLQFFHATNKRRPGMLFSRVSSIPVIGRGAAICHLVRNQIALTVMEERRRKQDDDECHLEA